MILGYESVQTIFDKRLRIDPGTSRAIEITKNVDCDESDEYGCEKTTSGIVPAQDPRGGDTGRSHRTVKHRDNEKAGWRQSIRREPGGQIGGPCPHLKES
jgi:hypothetical protein